jgi:hypothetical protein
MHFTEHLVDAFKKSSQKSDLNQDPSSLLIRWLKNHTGTQIDQLNHDMSIAPVAHKEIDKLEEKPKQAAPELSRALHCTGWDAVEATDQEQAGWATHSRAKTDSSPLAASDRIKSERLAAALLAFWHTDNCRAGLSRQKEHGAELSRR